VSLQALPYWITLLLVVVSPLFFGAAYGWGYTAMAVFAGLALALLASRQALRGESTDLRLRALTPAIVIYLLVLAWSVVQWLPGLAFGEAQAFWSQAATLLQADMPDSLTINPSLTLYAIVRLACYGAVFLVMFWYARDVRRARQVVTAVAGVSIVYAVYGLVVYFSGNETILWYPKPSYKWSLTSVFVNRNNYAAYVGLGLLCCVAVLHWRMRDRWHRAGGQLGFAQGLAMLLVLPNALLLMGCLVLATALLLTQSRGGAATTLVGLLVYGYFMIAGRNFPRWAIAVFVALVLLAALFVLALSGDVTLSRLANLEVDFAFRFDIYALSLQALADRPLVGFGLGTFEDVFRLYRTPLFPERYTMAHNSYLELAVDVGLPFALLFMLALAWPVWRCWRGVAARRWGVTFPALGLAASAQIGLHSLVDFPLQLPALAATYAALMAVATAQSWPRNEAPSEIRQPEP